MHKIAITIARICCLTKESKTSRTHFSVHTSIEWMPFLCDCDCECAHVSLFLSLCLSVSIQQTIPCFKSAFEARARERKRLNKKKVIWFDFILKWKRHTYYAPHSLLSTHTTHRVIERNAISFIESLGGNWFLSRHFKKAKYLLKLYQSLSCFNL